MGKDQDAGLPRKIAESLPTVEQIVVGLVGSVRTIGPVLYRAAYPPAGILPDRVLTPYRFGPPPALVNEDGTMPFQWLYAAPDEETTIWEARFASNDVRRPGTFYLTEDAQRDGLIARLAFPRLLRVWDLCAPASSLLGIYDHQSSPDHEWGQWFGARLHTAMQQVNLADRPDGAVYPSRRYRGKDAIIISFEALASMREAITQTATRFIEHSIYAQLLRSPRRSDPPERWVGGVA